MAVALSPGRLGIGDPTGFGPTQLAAVLIGTAGLGAALAGRRFVTAYPIGAVLLVNTFLLLACCELGAALVLLRVPQPAPKPPLPGEASPCYRDKPWAAAY